MKENNKEKNQLENAELENIDGGRFNPTWFPVDEMCKDINQGTTCSCPGMKGEYGNCRDCKHY